MCLCTCYFLYQMYSCCFALMENTQLFFKSKFKSCLVFEVFSAFPRQRGSLPHLCCKVPRICICHDTAILDWSMKNFPSLRMKLRASVFFQSKRGRTEIHTKIKPESKEFPLLISRMGGRVQFPITPCQWGTECCSGHTETTLLLARSCGCNHKSKDKNGSFCVKLLQGEGPEDSFLSEANGV